MARHGAKHPDEGGHRRSPAKEPGKGGTEYNPPVTSWTNDRAALTALPHHDVASKPSALPHAPDLVLHRQSHLSAPEPTHHRCAAPCNYMQRSPQAAGPTTVSTHLQPHFQRRVGSGALARLRPRPRTASHPRGLLPTASCGSSRSPC